MTPAPGITDSPARTARQHWLAVLALAPAAALMARSAPVVDGEVFEPLRPAEQGLAMLCARIGGTGDRFNLGEATLARSVVRHRDAVGQAAIGVGYVLGRQAERARRIAELDALLQQPVHHERVMREVVEPLQLALAARHAAERQRADASRVRFVELRRDLDDDA